MAGPTCSCHIWRQCSVPLTSCTPTLTSVSPTSTSPQINSFGWALALSLVPLLSFGQPDRVTTGNFEIGGQSCLLEHSCKIGNMHALQRWGNNSLVKWYSNSWDQIVIFVFRRYFHFSFSGDFSKQNNICIHIWLIFQKRILFVFVFCWS